MAIQELVMNFVLLCYFYGIDLRENQKDDSAFVNSIVDGLMERQSIMTLKDPHSKNSTYYLL